MIVICCERARAWTELERELSTDHHQRVGQQQQKLLSLCSRREKIVKQQQQQQLKLLAKMRAMRRHLNPCHGVETPATARCVCSTRNEVIIIVIILIIIIIIVAYIIC